MIFVNFKAYQEGTGQKAVSLARILEEVARASQIKVIPVVQAGDIKEIVATVKLEVWSQKVDPVTPGAHTGAILAEAVLDDGASGTFLNHSENKLESFDDLAQAVSRSQEVGLKSLVFAADIKELKLILRLKSTLVAYEPPELIGSHTTSVAQAQPEVIAQAATLAKSAGIPLIVGAGVHSAADVRKSLELGAVGVAVSSDIVKAADPRVELLDLIKGFQ